MNSSTDTPDGKTVKKPQKYMFDAKDFDRSETPEDNAPVFSEEQVLLARKEGHAQGKAEGLKESRQQQEEKIVAAAEKMLAHAEKLLLAEQNREIKKQAETLNLVRQIMQKLLPALAKEHAMGEVFKTVLTGLEERKEEPRIAITVHDSLFSAFKERIEKMASERGFTSKLIVLADETLPPTDCKVEWADGGIERSFEKIYTAIDVEIKKTLGTLSNSNGEKT